MMRDKAVAATDVEHAHARTGSRWERARHFQRHVVGAAHLATPSHALETALVVDPKNRAAFTVMAKVAIKEKLYGQAIRLTNKALALEPTDRDALAVQGEAMVELGALPRAKDNLAKLQQLCGTAGCPQVAVLSTAIAKGPALAAAKPPEVPKKN